MIQMFIKIRQMLMKCLIQSSSIVTVQHSTSNADIDDNLIDDGVSIVDTDGNNNIDDYNDDYDYENKLLFPFSTGSFGQQDGFPDYTGKCLIYKTEVDS